MRKLIKEKVLLAIVYEKDRISWPVEELAGEMEELVKACCGEVVEKIFCPLESFNAAHLIGKGKVEEIALACSQGGMDTVIFSYDLKGSQQRNLEEALKVKTIDRTQLILDIFARHATSQEGKMQVELAQLEYLMPRLVGQGIALSRLGGGIGTVGPGETKLEVDRRRISQRISKLKKDLAHVVLNRDLKRKKRKQQGVPLVSLVGYTNAGKTTLLNLLTGAHQLTKDGLFTTLDSLSRQFTLATKQKVVLSDTVGFMHELPHHLIEAFKATLEEVVHADILIHVMDISDPYYLNLHQAVLDVLAELKVEDKPVITVLNKIDQMPDSSSLGEKCKIFKNPVPLSAKTGENKDVLVELLGRMLSRLIVQVDVYLPINRMDLVNLAHKVGQVLSIKYYNKEIYIQAVLPEKTAGLFEQAAIFHEKDE